MLREQIASVVIWKRSAASAIKAQSVRNSAARDQRPQTLGRQDPADTPIELLLRPVERAVPFDSHTKWITFYVSWEMLTVLDVNDADKDGSTKDDTVRV